MMIENTSRAQLRQKQRFWGLLLLLLAFSRLTISLDTKDLWLDESFSLQRAESDWSALLRGAIRISDGVDGVDTADQHPFTYFALLGVMLRGAGTSEFALRFPSVMAATLIVPGAWLFARRLARCGILPPTAPAWAALLAAVNPFYLWFGQEVRMYAFVALMALLSTYMILSWSQARSPSQYRFILGYLITICLLLTSHYYSVLILPVHAGIVFARLMAARRRLALGVVGSMFILGLLAAAPAAYQLIVQPGSGTNFVSLSLGILIPDLVNAFTLGLSVNLADVWPIDVLSALVMLLGVTWGLRSRRAAPWLAWLLPVYLLAPVLLLTGINLLRPAYMNARHISLVSGAYLLLVSGGLAWLWRKQRWLSMLAASILLGGMLYSSVNYYIAPQYDKGDMTGMGAVIDSKILPGDFLLIEPPMWTRLFRYYLPIDKIERWQAAGQITGWRAVPPLRNSQPEDLDALLAALRSQYQRLWLARAEPESQSAKLLQGSTFRAQEWGFESPISFLHLELFQVTQPVVGATWDAGVSLNQWRSSGDTSAGETLRLEFEWQRMAEIVEPLRVGLELSDDTQRIWAQQLSVPCGGQCPTDKWGDRAFLERQALYIPPDTPPGNYHLYLYWQRADGAFVQARSNLKQSLHHAKLLLADVAVYPPQSEVAVTPLAVPVNHGVRPGLSLRSGELTQTTIRAGANLGIALQWEVTAEQPALNIQLQVVGPSEIMTAPQPLGTPTYPSSFWTPGRFVRTQDLFVLPGVLNAGIYRVNVLVNQPGKPEPIVAVPLGNIEVTERPRNFDLPPTGAVVNGEWREGIRLARVAMPVHAQTDMPLSITLVWQAAGATERNWKVFIHLVDEAGIIRAQGDAYPINGGDGPAPTSSWRKGEVILDEHILTLPPDLPSGAYTVLIGLYDEVSNERLPLLLEGEAYTLPALLTIETY